MKTRILGISLKDKMKNGVLRRSVLGEAGTKAMRLEWSWSGHVTRMDQDRWAYATTLWDPREEKRGRVRPGRDGPKDLAQ